jgi:hypothetical protein
LRLPSSGIFVEGGCLMVPRILVPGAGSDRTEAIGGAVLACTLPNPSRVSSNVDGMEAKKISLIHKIPGTCRSPSGGRRRDQSQ